ncbi:hypothetical protein FOC1_g10014263 [Fusarium oxysporum f. sp. cubense race 1]|uniref:Uncharacterized protein n=1 Tax=Fusarium oxysporum f. sp. cubense (strain race 1) TaxID=1229664 RepID=N4TXZ3_FUSC1|nr:hypothetical protein FOC1_g10014263 [Fusarium oxysporum f. sp. cubense race 1]
MVTLEGHIRIHDASLDFFLSHFAGPSAPTGSNLPQHTTLVNPRKFTGASYRGDSFRKLQTFKGTAVRDTRPSPSRPLTSNRGALVAGGKKANKQNHIETQP